MSKLSFSRAVWIYCFIATLAVVVATAVPLFGILFVMLGAPLLPTLLLNGAFMAMAVDALYSRIWFLLAPPLLWFGGYAIISAISHKQVTSHRLAATSMNANGPIRWDQTTQFVQIDKTGTSSENYASNLTPAMLIENYGLDNVYATYRSEQSYESSSTQSTIQRVVLTRNSCPERGVSVSNSLQHHPIWRGGYPSKKTRQQAEGLCLIYQSDALPPDSPIIVALAPVQNFSGLVAGIAQDITISVPNQPHRNFRAVQIAPLPWWPMPVIGCHYKGGFGDQFDNDCHAEFDFSTWRGQDKATPVAVVAEALGLKTVTIEQRLKPAVWK